MMRLRRVWSRLWRDRRGVSAIEFAFCLPLLVILTRYAFEMVNYIMVREQISQIALQIADNASRIGTQNTVQTQIDEKQVNDLLLGADLQSSSLGLKRNGRIILSSLEVDPAAPGGQYIHWQRCYGDVAAASSYGVQGDGKGSLAVSGMGPTNGRVTALPNIPTMFVEIAYRYQPVVSSFFAPTTRMNEIATMLVRDNRDTSGDGINPVTGVTASRC